MRPGEGTAVRNDFDSPFRRGLREVLRTLLLIFVPFIVGGALIWFAMARSIDVDRLVYWSGDPLERGRDVVVLLVLVVIVLAAIAILLKIVWQWLTRSRER